MEEGKAAVKAEAKQNLRRIGLILLLVAGAALGAFMLAPQNVRYFIGYQLAPSLTRDAGLERYQAPSGTTVHHLGTLHGLHRQNEAYGLEHVQAVVANLKPTLLMVEVLPEEAKVSNYAVGPTEMTTASLFARSMGIPVVGIDWLPEDYLTGKVTDDRDDRMFAQLQSSLPGEGSVLVLTGFAHQLAFRERFAAAGFQTSPLSSAEKDALFRTEGQPFRYPEGMAGALDLAIAWSEERMEMTGDPHLKQVYEAKRSTLEGLRGSLTGFESEQRPLTP